MQKRFSHSALSTFDSCRKKFEFQYLIKPTVPPRVTPDTHLGSIVHRVLRRLHSLGADGIVMPQRDTLDFYHSEWEKLSSITFTLVADYYTVDDYIRIGSEMLTRYHEKYAPFKEGTLLGTELNLTFMLPNSPFKFIAKIDRLTKRDDGVVEIWDYKTGKTISRPQEKSFRNQMGLYQLAVQDAFPQFTEIELVQHFLRHDEMVRCRMAADELEMLALEFKSLVYEAFQAEKMADFPPHESGLCNYCSYRSLCPAKRHEQLIEQSDDDEETLTPEAKGRELADSYISANQAYGEARSLREQLKEEIVELARETGWRVLSASQGKVSIRLSEKEKFITKTEDFKKFADLSALARELDLEAYFNLDGRALMKDIYQKHTLADEQHSRLEDFVIRSTESRLIIKLKNTENSE